MPETTEPLGDGPHPKDGPIAVDDARRIVERFRREVNDQTDPDVDDLRLFRGQSSEAKARLRQALATLLDQGNEGEQQYAAWMLGYEGTAQDMALMARLYVVRGWDTWHIASMGLARQHHMLTAEERQGLSGVFLTDPSRHLRIVRALFLGPHDDALWQQFAAFIAGTDDAKTLGQALEATLGTPRVADFGMLMRARPEAIVRAVVEQVGGGWDRILLPAWGFGPRNPPTRE